MRPICEVKLEYQPIITGFLSKDSYITVVSRTIVNVGFDKRLIVGSEGKILPKILISPKNKDIKHDKATNQTKALLMGSTITVLSNNSKVANAKQLKLQESHASIATSTVLQQSLNCSDVDNLRWIIKDKDNIPISNLSSKQVSTLCQFLFDAIKNDPILSDSAILWLNQVVTSYSSVMMKDSELLANIADIRSLFDYKAKAYSDLIALKLKLELMAANEETKPINLDEQGPLLVYEEADEDELENIEEYVPVQKQGSNEKEVVAKQDDDDIEAEVMESEEKDVIKFDEKSNSED